MEITRTAVVGAGTMGHQIAIVLASGGFETRIHDVDLARLESALAGIEGFLDKSVGKGKLDADTARAIRGRIRGAGGLHEATEGAGFVVEAVFEQIDVKRDLFHRLDGVCDPATILATNTSTLSVTEIAAATGRADRCIGTHFLIPAALTPLVEVARGLGTSDETHAATCALLGACKKDTVTVADYPGFAINRLYIPFMNEAFTMLGEGVATPAEIDKACQRGLGMPLGPLAAADASGLDVVLACVESLHQQLGDKYRPAQRLVQLVRAGHLGRKTGRGVYTY